jgi:hypothetical protein
MIQQFMAMAKKKNRGWQSDGWTRKESDYP